MVMFNAVPNLCPEAGPNNSFYPPPDDVSFTAESSTSGGDINDEGSTTSTFLIQQSSREQAETSFVPWVSGNERPVVTDDQSHTLPFLGPGYLNWVVTRKNWHNILAELLQLLCTAVGCSG